MFDAVWRSLPIPGEYDAMDDLDKARWRGVVEAAYLAGVRQATDRAARICDRLLFADIAANAIRAPD